MKRNYSWQLFNYNISAHTIQFAIVLFIRRRKRINSYRLHLGFHTYPPGCICAREMRRLQYSADCKTSYTFSTRSASAECKCPDTESKGQTFAFNVSLSLDRVTSIYKCCYCQINSIVVHIYLTGQKNLNESEISP